MTLTKITSARTEQLRKAIDNLEINSILIDRADRAKTGLTGEKKRNVETRTEEEWQSLPVEMGIGPGSVFAGQITSA